ncbi:MAG: LysR family transcriptional regulator [Lachnospiraceae bacterium]|nr:LysR family transcriptional regulator [Lachnospiraceae bacterium]
MTIRHLKIFITVADCGKMNMAAKKLYISQPSVSQAIQELEKEYGIQLFDRLSQRLYITDNGKKLLSYARHIVDSYEEMDLMMKNAGEHPRIRVGASVSVGTCLIDKVITKLEEKNPKIEIRVVINNTSTIEKMLADSELDVGIVEGLITNLDMLQIPLCEDELVIVAGKQHPFYLRTCIQLQELQNTDFVAREDGSMVRNQYEQLLQNRGITVNTKWNSTNTEAIKNAVIAGKGIAILSGRLVEKEVESKELRVIPVEDVKVERTIHLVYHKNKYVSEMMQLFIDTSRQTL